MSSGISSIVAAGRLAAEVVIECHHAMHLGARQVERLGDHRDNRLRHTAERRLDIMKNGQQRTFLTGVGLDQVRGKVCVPLRI